MKSMSLVVVVAMFLLINNCTSNHEQPNPENYYAHRIERKIASCEKGAAKITSKNVSIRDDAELNALKTKFYRTSKSDLIRRMAAENVELRIYKVEYFLVNAFYHWLNARTTTSMGALSEARSIANP